MASLDELRKQKEDLQQENAQLKRNLRTESKERDELEKELNTTEKAKKQLESQIKKLTEDLDKESKERDVLDQENGELNRKLKSLQGELLLQKAQSENLQDEINKLKDAKNKSAKRIEEIEKEHEQEVDKLRDDIRQLKREMRDKVRKVEEEKENLEREIRRSSSARSSTRLTSSSPVSDSQVKALEKELSDTKEQLKLLKSSNSNTTDSQKQMKDFIDSKQLLITDKEKMEEKMNSLQEELKKLNKEKESFELSKKELDDEIKNWKNKFENEKKEKSEKILRLEDEIAKIKKESKDEFDKLKKQFTQHEDSQKIQDELRALLQTGRNLDEIIIFQESQHSLDLKQQNEELEQELSALKVEVAEQESLVQELEEAKNALQSQLVEKQKEISSRDMKVFQDEINKLTRELENINSQLNDEKKSKKFLEEQQKLKEKEYSIEKANAERDLKDLNAKLEKAIKDKQESIEKSNDIGKQLTETISMWQSKFDAAKKTQEKELNELKQSLDKTKQQLEESIRESKSLNKELKKARDEIGESSAILEREKESKKEVQAEISKLQSKIEELSSEISNQKKIIAQLNDEKSSLESEVESLKEDVEHAKEQAKIDIEEMKKSLQSETGERRRSQKMESKYVLELNSLKTELEEQKKREIQKETIDVQQKLQAALKEKDELLKKLSDSEFIVDDLEEDIKDLKTEIEKSEEIRKKLMSQVRELEDKLDQALDDLDQEVKAKKRAELQIVEAMEHLEDLKREKITLEKEKLNPLKEKVEKLSDENSTLDRRRRKLEDELKEAQKSLDDEVKTRQASENSNKELKKEVDSLRKESENLKNQITSKISNEKQASAIQLELESAKKTLKEYEKKDSEIDSLKKKLRESEKQALEIESLKLKVKELDMKEEEKESLKKKLRETQSDYQSQIDQLTSEISKLKKELAGVSLQNIEQLKRENEELRRQISELSGDSSGVEDLPMSTSARLTSVKKNVSRPQRRPPSGYPATPSTSTDTPTETAPKVVVEAPKEEPRKPDAKAIGGISLFGGISADQLARSKIGKSSSSKETQSKNRLYQIKGRRRIRSFQVEVSPKGLNKGDVFILDTGSKIFQWNGSECNRLERAKGKDIVSRLNRTRGGRSQVIVIDEGDQDDQNTVQFWKELGGKAEIQPAKDDDSETENEIDSNVKFFSVSEIGELLKIEGALVYELLDSSSCYLLDSIGELYIWIGKKSGKEVRAAVEAKANEVFSSIERPNFAEITRCVEGGESVFFCEKFSNWPDEATLGPQKFISNVAASKKQEKIDVERMYYSEPPASYTFKDPDELADGKVEIWIVRDAIKEEWPTEKYGQFWSNHSFIVLYSYGSEQSYSYVVYFWQGRDCMKAEKGTSAAIAMNLAKRYPGSEKISHVMEIGASQIRVEQNKEPAHFLKIFKGKLIVHKGSMDDSASSNGLYQIRGTNNSDSLAIEVDLISSLLNSNDCFILRYDSTKGYIWIGSKSNKYEASQCNEISKLLKISTTKTVKEGEEGDDFWKLIGGKSEYGAKLREKEGWKHKCFFFSNASGMLAADPIFKFSQDDLTSEVIVLLDTFFEIFLWVGSKSREADKKIALETAIDYSKKAVTIDGRPSSTKVTVVNEGSETVDFLAVFHGWSRQVKKLVSTESADKVLAEYSRTFTYEQLKNRDKLPKSVDKTQLEFYLSDEEFVKIMGVDKETWTKMPAWKKEPKKKQVGLF